jgi:alanyl-tRNA synthetase
VQREAKEFSEQLDRLDHMPFSTEKEELVKQTKVELNQLSISAIVKSQMRTQFEGIAKKILAQQKEAQKAITKKVLDIVQSNISKKPEQEGFIIKLPFSVSSKAVPEAIKSLNSSKDAKLNSKTIYLLGAEAAEGKVSHGCYVAAHSIAKGVVASEWTNSVATKVGGKTGGKGATSTGTGNKLDEIDAGVMAATQVG